jgi:RNA polymerase sigma factor (TIGR02999 family)
MLMRGMTDVTQILRQIEAGDPSAADQLLPLVYDELRKLAARRMAGESPDHTLQATALVHEAYLRLVDAPQAQHWNSRGHFFMAAAEAMRRILVESARRKLRLKHGGDRRRLDLGQIELSVDQASDEVLALDEALERLATDEPACAELVKLRYFAGLTIEEAAAARGTSVRTANRDWAYAKAWLHQQLRGEAPAGD